MDAPTLTKLVGELNKAAAPKPDSDSRSDEEYKKETAETLVKILSRIQKEVQPTEELLKASKAGVVINKLKANSDAQVVSLAKDIVKSWKDKIEENKKKRKRAAEDSGAGESVKKEEGKDTKRVKAEASSASPAPSPAGTSKVKEEDTKPSSSGGAKKEDSPPSRPPLSTIDSSRKVPRTAKADGVASSLKATPDDGDDQRTKCVVLLYDALAGDSTAEKKLLTERAQSIERAVWEVFNGSTGNDYRQKMRSLYLNLKDKQNPALRNEIVLGYITGEQVANMSKEEMASESVRALNEKLAMENLFKAKAVGETQAETDAFKCGRCQMRKCTYYQMQTRSADEPMTTFVTCVNCGNRWKFS